MSEPFDPARWRPAPFLPEKEARDGALIFVVAVLCFMACLTAMGVLAANRAAGGWTGQLTGEATVIVRPHGGEKQRLAIARAVVNRPEILLADEPTGNVDHEMALRIFRLFVELNRLGTTVVIATHDPGLVARSGKPVLHLEGGRLERRTAHGPVTS